MTDTQGADAPQTQPKDPLWAAIEDHVTGMVAAQVGQHVAPALEAALPDISAKIAAQLEPKIQEAAVRALGDPEGPLKPIAEAVRAGISQIEDRLLALEGKPLADGGEGQAPVPAARPDDLAALRADVDSLKRKLHSFIG